jgi:Terpene cyclase DEP1
MMKLKTLYLILCVIGAVLPYWQFVPWVSRNGLNASLFLHQLFANRISSFFGMDVLVSAAVLLVFVRSESSRLRIAGRWLPILALLLVGVSLAFPMFLYMRERDLEKTESTVSSAYLGQSAVL